jgi:hypothetical protein
VPSRFYFDIENGNELIRDEEGVEADSLVEALDEAQSVITEMADEVASAAPNETWTLVVRNCNGILVARLPIRR